MQQIAAEVLQDCSRNKLRLGIFGANSRTQVIGKKSLQGVGEEKQGVLSMLLSGPQKFSMYFSDWRYISNTFLIDVRYIENLSGGTPVILHLIW